LELRRPRPHGASVLNRQVSIRERSEHWTCLLSGNGLGVGATILLNGLDVEVRPQNLQVSVRKGSSESVDDVPLVRDLGLRTDPAGDGGDTGGADDVVLESYDVTSGNGVLGLRDGNEGRRSSEDRENAEGKSDESVEEHDGCLEPWSL